MAINTTIIVKSNVHYGAYVGGGAHDSWESLGHVIELP